MMSIINQQFLVEREDQYAQNFFDYSLFDDAIIHAIQSTEIALAYGIEKKLSKKRYIIVK